MTGSELSQRLAAVLAADAAGYSRLMAVDAMATVAALDAARSVFRTVVDSSQGRVIDMAGDSILAIFDTASGAVAAALAIQDSLLASAADMPQDRRMHFRIGVYLGDVIQKPDGTVYGDGVNIAARLQSLASPGEIAVSAAVREAVSGKVSGVFADLGEQRLKNIPHAVRVFSLRSARNKLAPPPAREPLLPLPDKPSVAVLPFTNLGGGAEEEYFGDAIAEDIITELSRFGRLFIIARNTSFTYRARQLDVQSMARQLGVHFVLEGSVRRSANRVRITAQLIEAESGAHVWAERYDDVVDDLFEVQDRITRQVVAAMVPQIEAEEIRLVERGQRRFTEADDISWRAWKRVLDSYFGGQPQPATEAVALARQAIERDTRCWLAHYVLSSSHAWQVFMGWAKDRRASAEAALRAADTLVLLAPHDGRSYHARASAASVSGNYSQGLADRRRAAQLNPNDATSAFFLSWAEAGAGNISRAKEVAHQALRLSPKDVWVGVAYLALAMAAFLERDLDELRRWAELAVQSQPTAPIRRVLMIAWAADAGNADLLALHRAKLASLAPDFVASLFRGDLSPFYNPADMAMLLTSLRKAGFPESKA